MINTNLLLDFCRESTEYVERNHLSYYWQAGDYKLHNKLLVSWFEKHYNTWASYITPLAQVKAGLKNPQSELDFVRSFAGKKTRLLLSGGTDSVTILDRFATAGVKIDQIFVYTDDIRGVNTDDVNEEQIVNAFPLLEKYGYTDRTRVYSFNDEYYQQLYSDPWVRLRKPHGASRFYNFLVDYYDDSIIDSNDGYVNIVGAEKPTIVYLNGRWYATFFDNLLDSRVSIPNPIYWWLDYRNISTWVNGARAVRDTLFADRVNKDTVFKIFVCSPQDLETAEKFNDAIGRSKLIRPLNLGKGFHGKYYNMREMRYMSKLLYAQQAELLTKYYTTISTAMSVFPDIDSNEKAIESKFGFFIDLDSLEVYTQEQVMTERLIPS
jgi:hypothetical protein